MCCLSMTCTLFSQRPAMAQPLEDDSPKSSPPPPKPTEISTPIREIEVYVPPPPPKEYVLPPSSEIIAAPVECPPTREPSNSTPRNNVTNVVDEPQYTIENSSSSSVYVSNSIGSAQPQVAAVQQYYLQKPTAEEALHKLIVMSDVGNTFILSTQTKRRGLWRQNTTVARNHIREMLNIAVFLPSENFAKVHPLMRDIYTTLNESVENHSISDADGVLLSRLQKSNTYYKTLIGRLNEILQEKGKD